MMTKSMPSVSQSWPKVKRVTLLCSSMPMVPSARPSMPAARPLATEPPTAASEISPTSTRPKYSGGPKASAILASAGARYIRPMVPTVPAMNEPMAAMPSAEPALPCWASLWPSTAVITLLASPGTLSRTAVSVPPYCDPA